MPKLYEIKKAEGEGTVIATVNSVSDYAGRKTAWCTLNDGAKYDMEKVSVFNEPREITQGDVGKSFEFEIKTGRSTDGKYVNVYAKIIKEVSPEQAKASNDSDVRGKCFCNVICAAIAGNQMECKSLAAVECFVDVIMASGDAQSTTDKGKGGIPEDEIPF